MYGLILSDGGITNICMNRMAKLYDTTTHQSLLYKQNQMAARYDIDLAKWQEFGIVLDNVDMFVRPRYETSARSNTMHHMVQAIAVEERVPPISESQTPTIAVDRIQPADVIPSLSDAQRVRELMVNEILRIWTQIPALRDTEFEKADERHTYTEEMSGRSNLVSKTLYLAQHYLTFDHCMISRSSLAFNNIWLYFTYLILVFSAESI